jgi:hypothetical protein
LPTIRITWEKLSQDQQIKLKVREEINLEEQKAASRVQNQMARLWMNEPFDLGV